MTTIEFKRPQESLVGKYVYIIRRGPEAGLLRSGTVLRIDEFGRCVIAISVSDDVVALPPSCVTTDISKA